MLHARFEDDELLIVCPSSRLMRIIFSRNDSYFINPFLADFRKANESAVV